MSTAIFVKCDKTDDSSDDEIFVRKRSATVSSFPGNTKENEHPTTDPRTKMVVEQRRNSREKLIKERNKLKSTTVMAKKDKVSKENAEQRPSKPKKKIIDWDKIHSKAFAKFDTLQSHMKKKESRSIALTTTTSTNAPKATTNEPNTEVTPNKRATLGSFAFKSPLLSTLNRTMTSTSAIKETPEILKRPSSAVSPSPSSSDTRPSSRPRSVTVTTLLSSELNSTTTTPKRFKATTEPEKPVVETRARSTSVVGTLPRVATLSQHKSASTTTTTTNTTVAKKLPSSKEVLSTLAKNKIASVVNPNSTKTSSIVKKLVTSKLVSNAIRPTISSAEKSKTPSKGSFLSKRIL